MAPRGAIEVKGFQDSEYQTFFAIDSQSGYVRFWVEPPVFPTVEGESVKLAQSEGWIDVRVDKNGRLEINGAHTLQIRLNISNQCYVELADG